MPFYGSTIFFKVPQYQWYLQLQGIVSPIIVHLNSNGVTNEDIININQLVMAFKNTSFVDEVSDQQEEEGGGGVPSKQIGKSNMSNNEYWKLFIGKLNSLKNINLEIARHSTILSTLKTQINHLNGKKTRPRKIVFGFSWQSQLYPITNILFNRPSQANQSRNKQKDNDGPKIFSSFSKFDHF